MYKKSTITFCNSGFSLIELIVVILIMGILAVSLTPQVLKWVDNSRKASDLDYMHKLESAVQYALMNSDVNSEVATAVISGGSDIVLTVDDDGTDDTIDGASDSKLLKKTAEVFGFGTDADGIQKFKAHKVRKTGGVIEIHINSGHAIGKYTVDGSPVDMTDE